MAFERLEPHRSKLEAWRRQGLTLAEIVVRLRDEVGISTTPSTLSRYFKTLDPALAPRNPTPAEAAGIDAASILVEVLNEIRGRGDETRLSIEHQAGQIRVLTEVIEEISGQSLPTGNKKSGSWLSFIFGLIVGGVVIGGLVFIALTAGALS